MEYTTAFYILWGILLPVLLVVLSFLTTFAFSRYILNRRRIEIRLLPLLIWFLVFILLLPSLVDGLMYPLALTTNSNVTHKAAGVITDIQRGPQYPCYLRSSTVGFVGGALWTIDNNAYFVPESNMISGTWVAIDWMGTQSERVVLKWIEIKPEEATAYQDTTALGDPQPDSEETETNLTVAYFVWYCSFFLFLLLLAVQHFLGLRIAEYLKRKDTEYRDGICSNWYGFLFMGAGFASLVGMATGWSLAGWTGIWIILCIGGIPIAYFLSVKRFTKLVFQDNGFSVCTFGKNKYYRFSDVQSVNWDLPRTTWNRHLVITMQGGLEFIFEQPFFWGLENAYSRIHSGKMG